MDPRERAYDRTIMTLKNPARSTDEEVYQAVIAYDPWDKVRDAYEKDPEQTAHLVAWVWRTLMEWDGGEESCGEQAEDPFTFCFGTQELGKWYPYPDDISPALEGHRDCVYAVDEVRNYLCEDGYWYEQKYTGRATTRWYFRNLIDYGFGSLTSTRIYYWDERYRRADRYRAEEALKPYVEFLDRAIRQKKGEEQEEKKERETGEKETAGVPADVPSGEDQRAKTSSNANGAGGTAPAGVKKARAKIRRLPPVHRAGAAPAAKRAPVRTGTVQETSAQKPAERIPIDFARLDRIRRDAMLTRDSLLTEEERMEEQEEAAGPVQAAGSHETEVSGGSSAGAAKEAAPEASAAPEGFRPVSAAPAGHIQAQAEETGPASEPVYLQILKKLLQGESVRGDLAAHHLLPSVAADAINEALFDTIGDNVVDCEGDELHVVEDYREDLLALLGNT